MVATLAVNECFVSVQGEGLLVGTPSTFVRVAGCNLRCAWCDSRSTSWEPRGEQVSLDALVERCANGPLHVVLTGGEPLLFAPIAELSRRLGAAGHHVTIETAATVWQDELCCDLASLSPKLAHSTPAAPAAWSERHEARRWNSDVVRRFIAHHPWQLKLVVRAYDEAALRSDVAEVERMIGELGIAERDRDKVLLMPECVDRARLAADYDAITTVCRTTGLRLGTRLHIEIFGHTPGT